jgi:hypothetical protein
MNISRFGIPEKSIWYIVICIGIIIIITILGIIPAYRYNVSANENIRKMNNQIKQQSDLMPQYKMLASILEKKQTQALPNPRRSKLPREQVEKFQQEFRSIADRTGMMVISHAPDMVNLASDSLYLVHRVAVKGDLSKFRRMLIELGSVPYLDRIDEISIEEHPDSLEYKLKIVIELASKG